MININTIIEDIQPMLDVEGVEYVSLSWTKNSIVTSITLSRVESEDASDGDDPGT